MVHNGIAGVPFKHADIEVWRDSLRRGITYPLPGTTLTITGGVDDVWVTPSGELHIVDYKATAKNGEVSLDADWQIGYKRQVEIYQWLFRKNGFSVSDTAYFVYCNGDKARPSFDGRLDFSIKVLPYNGNPAWIEPTLMRLFEVLKSPSLPPPAESCDYCAYRSQAAALERWPVKRDER
jgi:RecB family exonuclease